MIYDKATFEKTCQTKKVIAGALPQINQTWCLAIKVGTSIAYLGDSNDESATEFKSLDDLIFYASNNEIEEVRVITGIKPWKF